MVLYRSEKMYKFMMKLTNFFKKEKSAKQPENHDGNKPPATAPSTTPEQESSTSAPAAQPTTTTHSVQSPQSPPDTGESQCGGQKAAMSATCGKPEPPIGIARKILPFAAFSLAFAIAMTLLTLSMNSTAMRHYQFRKNMTQDKEFPNVSQDDVQLITYIRELQLKRAIETHHHTNNNNNNNKHNSSEFDNNSPSEETLFVHKLLNQKKNGVFVESGAYMDGKTSKTEWLEKKFNWRGLLVQSDMRRFFALRRHNRQNSLAVHTCLSPMPYMREVTLHHLENEVIATRIHANSVAKFDESEFGSGNGVAVNGIAGFPVRIKCFPLYSLLLAMNITGDVDYLSLESAGSRTELQVLKTVPFDKVHIRIISVQMDYEVSIDEIGALLDTKNYEFMQSFNNNTYVFKLRNKDV